MPTTKFHRITEYDELKGTHKRATEYNSGLHKNHSKLQSYFCGPNASSTQVDLVPSFHITMDKGYFS